VLKLPRSDLRKDSRAEMRGTCHSRLRGAHLQSQVRWADILVRWIGSSSPHWAPSLDTRSKRRTPTIRMWQRPIGLATRHRLWRLCTRHGTIRQDAPCRARRSRPTDSGIRQPSSSRPHRGDQPRTKGERIVNRQVPRHAVEFGEFTVTVGATRPELHLRERVAAAPAE